MLRLALGTTGQQKAMNKDRGATSKSGNQPQCTGRCGTKRDRTDTGTLVEETDACLGAVEKTC